MAPHSASKQQIRKEVWELVSVSSLVSGGDGSPAYSQWFSWAGARWQLSCSLHPAEDRVSLQISFAQKSGGSCPAYVALQILNRRHGEDYARYMPLHVFSSNSSQLTVDSFLHVSSLMAANSPYLVNDSLLIAAQLSSEPLIIEELLPRHGERMQSPFSSMFDSNLTRFMSGNAFAEVRLAVSGADPSSEVQHSMLAHISRLGRVSAVLRRQLSQQLKNLKVRPQGYGVWQPLVSLDTSQHVLQAFYQLLYKEEVQLPLKLLSGLLDLAAKYDMLQLELWVLQQAQKHGKALQLPAARGYGRVQVTPAPESACSASSSRRGSQDFTVKLSAAADIRRQKLGVSEGGANVSENAELAAALRARYDCGTFVDLAPEPESRSCGKDVFLKACRMYDEAISSLDQEAADLPTHSSYSTSSYNSWVADDGSMPPKPEASLQEQLDFWRHQQELLQLQLAQLPPSSRPGSRASSRAPSCPISRVNSGNFSRCSDAQEAKQEGESSSGMLYKHMLDRDSARQDPQLESLQAAATAAAAAAAARRESAAAAAGAASAAGSAVKQGSLQRQYSWDPEYQLEQMTNLVLQRKRITTAVVEGHHPNQNMGLNPFRTVAAPPSPAPAAGEGNGSSSSSKASPFSAYAWDPLTQVEQLAAAILGAKGLQRSSAAQPERVSSAVKAAQRSLLRVRRRSASDTGVPNCLRDFRMNSLEEVKAMAAAVLARKQSVAQLEVARVASTSGNKAAAAAASSSSTNRRATVPGTQVHVSPADELAAMAAAILKGKTLTGPASSSTGSATAKTRVSTAGTAAACSGVVAPASNKNASDLHRACSLGALRELEEMAAAVLSSRAAPGTGGYCSTNSTVATATVPAAAAAAADCPASTINVAHLLSCCAMSPVDEVEAMAASVLNSRAAACGTAATPCSKGNTGNTSNTGNTNCTAAGGQNMSLTELQQVTVSISERKQQLEQQQQQRFGSSASTLDKDKDSSKSVTSATTTSPLYIDPLAELQAVTANIMSTRAVSSATAAVGTSSRSPKPLHLQQQQQLQTSAVVAAAKQNTGILHGSSTTASYLDPVSQLQAMAAVVLKHKQPAPKPIPAAAAATRPPASAFAAAAAAGTPHKQSASLQLRAGSSTVHLHNTTAASMHREKAGAPQFPGKQQQVHTPVAAAAPAAAKGSSVKHSQKGSYCQKKATSANSSSSSSSMQRAHSAGPSLISLHPTAALQTLTEDILSTKPAGKDRHPPRQAAAAAAKPAELTRSASGSVRVQLDSASNIIRLSTSIPSAKTRAGQTAAAAAQANSTEAAAGATVFGQRLVKAVSIDSSSNNSSTGVLAGAQFWCSPVAGLQAMSEGVLQSVTRPNPAPKAAEAAAVAADMQPSTGTVTEKRKKLAAAVAAKASTAKEVCDMMRSRGSKSSSASSAEAPARPERQLQSSRVHAAAPGACPATDNSSSSAPDSSRFDFAAVLSSASLKGASRVDELQALADQIIQATQHDADRAGSSTPSSVANIRSNLLAAICPKSPKTLTPTPNAATRLALTARLPTAKDTSTASCTSTGSTVGACANNANGSTITVTKPTTVGGYCSQEADTAATICKARDRAAAGTSSSSSSSSRTAASKCTTAGMPPSAAHPQQQNSSEKPLDVMHASCKADIAAAAAAGKCSSNQWEIAAAEQPLAPCSPSTPSSGFSAGFVGIPSSTGSTGCTDCTAATAADLTSADAAATGEPVAGSTGSTTVLLPASSLSRTHSGRLSDGSTSSICGAGSSSSSSSYGSLQVHKLTTSETAAQAWKLAEQLQITAVKAAVTAAVAAAATAAAAEASNAEQKRRMTQLSLAEIEQQLQQEAEFSGHLLTEQHLLDRCTHRASNQWQPPQRPFETPPSKQQQQQPAARASRSNLLLSPRNAHNASNSTATALVEDQPLTEQARRRMLQDEQHSLSVLAKLKQKEEKLRSIKEQRQAKLEMQRPQAGWLSPNSNTAVGQVTGQLANQTSAEKYLPAVTVAAAVAANAACPRLHGEQCDSKLCQPPQQYQQQLSFNNQASSSSLIAEPVRPEKQQQQQVEAAAAAAAALMSHSSGEFKIRTSVSAQSVRGKSLRHQHQERMLAQQQQIHWQQLDTVSSCCSSMSFSSMGGIRPLNSITADGQVFSPRPPSGFESLRDSPLLSEAQSPRAAQQKRKADGLAAERQQQQHKLGGEATQDSQDSPQQLLVGAVMRSQDQLDHLGLASTPHHPDLTPLHQTPAPAAVAPAAAGICSNPTSESSGAPVKRSKLRMLQAQSSSKSKKQPQQPTEPAGLQYSRLPRMIHSVAVSRDSSFTSNCSAATASSWGATSSVSHVGPTAAAATISSSTVASRFTQQQEPAGMSGVMSLINNSIDASDSWSGAGRCSGGGGADAGSYFTNAAAVTSGSHVAASAEAAQVATGGGLWCKLKGSVSSNKLMPLLAPARTSRRAGGSSSNNSRASETDSSKKKQRHNVAAAEAAAALELLAQEQQQVLARSTARNWQAISGYDLMQIQHLTADELMYALEALPAPAGGDKAARDFVLFEFAMMWVEGDRLKRQHSRRLEDSLEMIDFMSFSKQQLWEARRFPAVDSSAFLRQRLLMAHQARMMQLRRELSAAGKAPYDTAA